MTSVPVQARMMELEALTAGAMDPCFQCGTCTATCPVLSVTGRKLEPRRLVRAAQLGAPVDGEALWSCTACRTCEDGCPRGVGIVESVMGLRAAAMRSGAAPHEAHKLLWSVLEEGNPLGEPRRKRADWSQGLSLKLASSGVKVLLYTGCATSYDPRLRRTARIVARLLTSVGIDFGVLPNEACCGDSVRVTGERGYLESLIASNIKTFQATGASTILTLSPHCYDMFRNLYPYYGLEAEVLHHTQYLADLIDTSRLRPARREASVVTYHDPCFLGRTNRVRDAPRRLIESVPGLTLEETTDGSGGVCCGGGGGGMWWEPAGPRLADARFGALRATGATTVATACPYCIQNFEDCAKRTSGPGVVDVAELLVSPEEARA